jgi:hypothetical protein
VLSAADSAPPDLDRQAFFGLFGDDWAERAAALVASGVLGVLRPGVDGDLAGLLSLTNDFEQGLLARLESDARHTGFDWAILSEDDFARRLAAEED